MSFSIFTAARACPDLPALVHRGETITYARLANEVAALARALDKSGIDTPVAFVARPEPASIARLLAAFERGLAVLPLHPKQSSEWHDALTSRTRATRIDDLRPYPGEPPPARPGEILALLPTSGSTGTPKLAVLSRSAFRAAVDASAARLGWRPDDRWLLSLTFAHVGGLSVLLRCLEARRPVVLATPDDDSLELIDRTRVTLASFVPTQLDALRRVSPPASLRAVLVGGAAAPQPLVRALRERRWPLRLTWGMTETCAQIATQHEGVALDDVTCGPPLPGYEAKSVDNVLHVRTPSLLDGWLEPEGVRDPRENGWLRTGDLGHLDERGHVVVLGRADDVIVTGGENVSPAAVEAKLLGIEGVTEACVFGLPDERWGQIVGAALVVRDPEALESRLRALASFERPRRIVLLPKLPQLPSGKIDRSACRRLAEHAGR